MTRLLSLLPLLFASVPALAGAGGGNQGGTGSPLNLPEPASLALLAAGVGALALIRKRRK